MKILERARATGSLAKYARDPNKEPVILTVGGKPVAALVPIENADLETVTLSTHPKFLALIERSQTRQKSEGKSSSAEMRRRLGIGVK
jgi:antitoxin (DNA-binding transcriptional repressor) of toxin-antitoxin stability system